MPVTFPDFHQWNNLRGELKENLYSFFFYKQ